MKKYFFIFIGFICLFLLTSCSSPHVTNTSRSAVEQLLLCAAIENGISKTDFSKYEGSTILLDYTNLTPQVDKNLIIAYLEMHLSNQGLIISKSDKQSVDFIIQVSCGVLATDIDKIIIGTPELPIPVPDTGVSIVIPEIPIFRRICRSAYGRFYFNILEAKTLKPIESFKGINSKTEFINWTILLIPFKTHNVPLQDEEDIEYEYIFAE